MVTRRVFDWLDERSFTVSGKASAAAQLAPRSPNSGADSWAAAAITTERFYSANLSEYPHSCNISMMIIRFLLQDIFWRDQAGWVNIIISHPCFVTKVHSLHGVCANFVLFQLHGTHSWTWKQVWIAANQMRLHPTLILLSRGSVNAPECLSLDSTASLGDRIQFSVCSSVYMHCMIDLDCYKVMCWKGKAVWWDMGMSFSRCDTGDMDSWLVNLG